MSDEAKELVEKYKDLLVNYWSVTVALSRFSHMLARLRQALGLVAVERIVSPVADPHLKESLDSLAAEGQAHAHGLKTLWDKVRNHEKKAHTHTGNRRALQGATVQHVVFGDHGHAPHTNHHAEEQAHANLEAMIERLISATENLIERDALLREMRAAADELDELMERELSFRERKHVLHELREALEMSNERRLETLHLAHNGELRFLLEEYIVHHLFFAGEETLEMKHELVHQAIERQEEEERREIAKEMLHEQTKAH